MAQRPTFPDPYLRGIDATQDNKFKCLINDKDVIKSYNLTIIDIKTPSSVKSFSGTETIYGGRGNDSYLIVIVPSGELTNGKDYKWKVSLTDNLGTTIESKEYYFKCIAEPIIEITSDNITNGILNSANAIFTGSYQCDSPLVYYRFILKKDNEIIEDTGEVYSQYISFEYDMFIQGNYSLILQTENDGKMKSEETLDFTVDYTPASTNIAPECYVSPNENSITVDFSNIMTIPGTYIPIDEKYHQINVSDTLKGVYIPKNTELYWQQRVGVSDNLDINEDSFAVQLMVNLPYGKQGKIIELSGDNSILVSFDGFNINWQYSNGISGSLSIGDKVFANIGVNDEINNEAVYTFYFDSTKQYNFSKNTQYMFQNPMNIYWWLLTITPLAEILNRDGVTAEKYERS